MDGICASPVCCDAVLDRVRGAVKLGVVDVGVGAVALIFSDPKI